MTSSSNPATLGGIRCWCSIALRTRHHLGVGGGIVTGGEKGLVILTSHCAKEVGAVQQVVNEKAKDLKARMGSDGTWHAQWHSALYAG
jgi:hypothetical protein